MAMGTTIIDVWARSSLMHLAAVARRRVGMPFSRALGARRPRSSSRPPFSCRRPWWPPAAAGAPAARHPAGTPQPVPARRRRLQGPGLRHGLSRRRSWTSTCRRRARRRTPSSSPSTGARVHRRRQIQRADHAGPGGPQARLRRGRRQLPAQRGGSLSRRPSATSRPPSAGCAPTRAEYGLDGSASPLWGDSAGGNLAGARRHLRRRGRPPRPTPANAGQSGRGPGSRRLVRAHLVPPAPTATSAPPASDRASARAATSSLSRTSGRRWRSARAKVTGDRPHHLHHARRPAGPDRARHRRRHRPGAAVGAVCQGLRAGVPAPTR